MRWALFAALCSLPLAQAAGDLTLTTPDGASLEIPRAFMYGIGIVEGIGRRDLLRGYSRSGTSQFLYARLPDPLPASSGSLLSQTAILSVLRTEGLLQPTFDPVTDSALKAPTHSILRINDPGARLDQYLILLATRRSEHNAAVFILLGPEQEFYQLTPAFTDLVGSFTMAAGTATEVITPRTVGTAVLLLVVNLAFVWFGLYRMSRHQSEALEDEV